MPSWGHLSDSTNLLCGEKGKEWRRRKKLSTQWDSNPRHLEFLLPRRVLQHSASTAALTALITFWLALLGFLILTKTAEGFGGANTCRPPARCPPPPPPRLETTWRCRKWPSWATWFPRSWFNGYSLPIEYKPPPIVAQEYEERALEILTSQSMPQLT